MCNQSLVVFDLDGTLNRTDLFSVPAIREIQRKFGVPESDYDTILSSYGTTHEEFMEIIFPGGGEEAARFYYEHIEEKETKYYPRARCYDGIQAMLDGLHHAGCLTAVCSNATMRYIHGALGAIGLTDRIDVIQALEPGMRNKSQSLAHLLKRIRPGRALMVGDTLFDYQAAQDNGLPFIGCSYGFRPYEMAKVPDAVQSPAEILPLALNLLEHCRPFHQGCDPAACDR
jgi:phosphoglycolate phosphatase